MATQKSEDARKFHHFYVYCARHGTKLQSLGEVGLHRVEHKENRHSVKFLCGCCGRIFRKMEEICSHINTSGFHLRRSSIPNYNKADFDVEAHISELETAEMLRAAAEDAKRQAASDRKALAAAAAPVLSRLQGEVTWSSPPATRIPPCCLFSADTGSARPLTTMAAGSPQPVSAVFLMQRAVMSTGSQAPAAATATVTRPEAASATPAQEASVSSAHAATPASLQSPEVVEQPTPTSSDLAVPTSPPVNSLNSQVLDGNVSAISDLITFGVSQPAPTFTTAGPDSSTDTTYVTAPPIAAAFEWQYPHVLYPTLPAMPTSYLMSSLVLHLQWLTSMLRAYVARSAPPSSLRFIDEGWRPLLMQTPTCPGSDYTATSDLASLLEALVSRYAELAHRVSYFR